MAKMTLEGLTEQLSRALGGELTALVLYGSAARGERVEKRSDYNVLVIVRNLTPAILRSVAPTARGWDKAGNPSPLILTEAEWRSCADVFAMEVADILDRHKVLLGALPAEPSRVDPKHLRHQLEYESMGKLFALRQGILAAEGDAKQELALLGASRSAILVLFRTLLRVHGDPLGADSADDVRAAAARAEFDPQPFLDVLAHVKGTAPISSARADAVLSAYHAGLERFVAHVDGLAP